MNNSLGGNMAVYCIWILQLNFFIVPTNFQEQLFTAYMVPINNINWSNRTTQHTYIHIRLICLCFIRCNRNKLNIHRQHQVKKACDSVVTMTTTTTDLPPYCHRCVNITLFLLTSINIHYTITIVMYYFHVGTRSIVC